MATTIDTLRLAKRFKDVRLSDEQAELFAEVFREVQEASTAGLAAKVDLDRLELALRADLERTEQVLRADLERTEQALRADLERTEQALRGSGSGLAFQHNVAYGRIRPEETLMEPAVRHPPLQSVEDFLAWVEVQRERYEFVQGRLVMMAGGSTVHNDIQVNLLGALSRRLRGGPCRPNGPDLLVRTGARTGRFPDASVSCGQRGRNFLADPVAVFEILSPSSEAEDRGPKRREYQALPSVQHYVLVAQDAPRAEVLTRTEQGWLLQDVEGLDVVLPLPALGIVLSLAELYEGVELPSAA